MDSIAPILARYDFVRERLEVRRVIANSSLATRQGTLQGPGVHREWGLGRLLPWLQEDPQGDRRPGKDREALQAFQGPQLLHIRDQEVMSDAKELLGKVA